MAKYLDKRFMFRGAYLHIGVVDLFFRSGSQPGEITYPVISIDVLKGVDRIGLVFTIPFAAVTLGYINQKTPES